MAEFLSDEPSWVILELMGHVRLAGRVSEEERFGVKMGRIDVPQEDGSFLTQYFSGSSVYRMTPVSEQVARHVAKGQKSQPVAPWDFPAEVSGRRVLTQRHDDDDEPFDGDERPDFS